MRELLSAEDEVSPHPSFFCPPPSRCASEPWAAAAAAFRALRLLAAEAQALDSSSCCLVEKLVRAATKRSSATDRGALTSVQQPEDAKQQQQQRANPEAWTQEEPAQTLRQTCQQQEQERQQQLEAELLRFWSDAALQRMSGEEATADCTPHPAHTPRKREGGHAEASTAEDQDSAGSVLGTVGQAQQVSSAAAPARETGAKTQRGEAVSPAVAACTSGSSAACSDGEAAGTRAFVEDIGATGGRRSAFWAAAPGAAQTDPCAAGAAASLMELERLLGALQELLNRLYNVAVHAQDAVDVLRWHLGPALAEHATEAAAAALPVAAAVPEVPAAQAGNATLLPAATSAEVVSAGSPETARAAALTGGAALAAEVSGCACAGRGAEEEKQKEENQINREKRVDAEEVHNKADENAGEDEGEQHLLVPRSRKKVGGTEKASEENSDFPSILFFGPRSGSAAEENKALRRIHQQQHNGCRWQRPNYLQGHRPSHERQHVRAEGRQQERQQEEQHLSQKQHQQQLLQSQQQQASHLQPPPSHEHPFAQPQKELVVAAGGLHEAQIQQQRRQKKSAEEEQQHCAHFSTLLQLCEEVAKTIEGDWRFKQEVKEEMHFDASLGVFLAAKAAWSAKPYVSDLAPLLCKIAPLAEQNSSTPQQ